MRTPVYRYTGAGLAGDYLSACNMDCRYGFPRPAPRQTVLGYTNVNQSSTTRVSLIPLLEGGIPTVWYNTSFGLRYLRSGLLPGQATDQESVALALYQNISTPPVSAIVICYGESDYIDLRLANGSMSYSSSVYLHGGVEAGGDFYGVCDGGAASDWKVSKLPAGQDILDSSKWGGGWPVGTAAWPVNRLLAIGGSPVACKADGLYAYESSEGRFVNHLPNIPIHKDNGAGAFTAAGAVYYPTYDGSLWRWDGAGRPVDVAPKHYSLRHRNAMHLHAPITAGCQAGDWTMVATLPQEMGWTQSVVSKVLLYDGNGATWSDLTDSVVDNKSSTVATLGGKGNGSYLYIGCTVPFEAIRFTIGTPNAVANYLDNVAVSTGQDQWHTSPVGTLYVGDSTSKNAVTLAQDGALRVGDPRVSNHTLMGKTTVWYGDALYYVRIAVWSTLTPATSISEIAVLPSRPPIRVATITLDGAGGILTVADPELEYTGQDFAGLFPHVLAGRDRGDGTWVWHDVLTLNTPGPVSALAMGDADTSQVANYGPSLFAVSCGMLSVIAWGMTDGQAPVSGSFASRGSVGAPLYYPSPPGTPVVYFAPNDLSDANQDRAEGGKTVEGYRVYGEYVESEDTVRMLNRFDHGEWEQLNPINGAPADVMSQHPITGIVLESALAYEDLNIELAGPRIKRVEAIFQDEPSFAPSVQPDARTPEVE